MEIEEEYPLLPSFSPNHISLVCKSLPLSLQFYEEVLGFACVQKSVPNFNDAWLFNYGIGIHLLQSEAWDTDRPEKQKINPKDNHISFQCPDISLTEKRLKEMGIDYVKKVVEEKGVCIDQLFFHDPDGYMIEICNCENFPIVPSGEEIEASGRNGRFSEQAQGKKDMVLDILDVFI